MSELDSKTGFAPIPEYPGYLASRDGFVWSIRPRNGKGAFLTTPRLMRGNIGKEGYLRISIHRGSRDSAVCRFVHLLVLSAFKGPRPSGMEARHLNGIKTDNRIENLEWGTHLENMADQVRHGTLRFGERNSQSKMDPDKVREIRELAARGVIPYRIGKTFGINAKTVQSIIVRKTWKHVA